MEKALLERVPSIAVEEITSLILDNTKLKSMSREDSTLLAKYTNLQHLACNRTGLKDLKNFPRLPDLRVLELTDNFLSDDSGLDSILQCESLHTLRLSGNKFKSCEDLRCLASLSNIKTLEMTLNPLTKEPDYRTTLFNIIPSLRAIDSVSREGNMIQSDEDNDDGDYKDTDSEGDLAERKQLIKDFYENEIGDNESDGGDFSPPPSDAEANSDEESAEDDNPTAEEDTGKRSFPSVSLPEETARKRQKPDDES